MSKFHFYLADTDFYVSIETNEYQKMSNDTASFGYACDIPCIKFMHIPTQLVYTYTYTYNELIEIENTHKTIENYCLFIRDCCDPACLENSIKIGFQNETPTILKILLTGHINTATEISYIYFFDVVIYNEKQTIQHLLNVILSLIPNKKLEDKKTYLNEDGGEGEPWLPANKKKFGKGKGKSKEGGAEGNRWLPAKGRVLIVAACAVGGGFAVSQVLPKDFLQKLGGNFFRIFV